MKYFKNDTTGSIGTFFNDIPPDGWTELTQEETDAYLLAQAKIDKLAILNGGKNAFCSAGLLYSGNTFSLSDASTQNIVLKNNVLGYVSDNVSAYTSGVNCYVLPQGHGLGFNPGQIIYVLGFTEGANNGAKTVDFLEDNYLNIVEALTDEAVGDLVSIRNDHRCEYYNTSDVQIDFTDCAGWNDFFAAMTNEKDRIMRYYCATKKTISDCVTVAEVDAITIDFSA